MRVSGLPGWNSPINDEKICNTGDMDIVNFA